jgi:hypothetical protein
MKTTDLWLKPISGQFWLDSHNVILYKVKSIKDDVIVFITQYLDDKTQEASYRLPTAGHILLWYETKLDVMNFSPDPKPGQIWVSNESSEVFIIHPDQSELSINTVRVLSNNNQLLSPYTLVHGVG